MWRSLDVGAVIDALRARGALLVAGSDGLTRPVRRALLAPAPDDLDRAGRSELVITTMAALTAVSEEWGPLVSRLVAAEVAGVALCLDASDHLPPELLVAGDRAALPLITFPGGATVADVTAAVLDALLEAQGRRLERVLEINQLFTKIGLAGGGTAEIAATLHDLVGYPVAVLDADETTTVVVPSGEGVTFDATASSGVRQPIRAGDQEYGEVVALTDGATLDEDQLFALERASMAIAVRLAQASAVAEAQERFAAVSLEELVAGHAGDAAEVAERAISFGWDLGRSRAVLLASIDPPTVSSTRQRALSIIAAAARATLGSDAIVWTRSATIAALVAPETDDPKERRRIAERLRRELDERLRSVNVSIGVGRRVDDPTLLPRSFLEASRAVDVGRWAKGRHVTEVFDELGLERLLASTPTDDLAQFVQHAIGPLLDHDRASQSDLVETLEEWLATRNMAEAARRMHVHYNTFKNRLERIETILGPIVADAARSLECEVAVYVARHYEGPWSLVPADGLKHDPTSRQSGDRELS
jgi:purine catabolism regulator